MIKSKTLEEIEKENELITKAKTRKLMKKVEKPGLEKDPGLRTFNTFVDDEYFEAAVEETGGLTEITFSIPPTRKTPLTPQQK